MPFRFDLSALSRRLSAKFALASLTAVVVITLVIFTARAWLIKSTPTNSQELAAAQGQPPHARIEAELITISPRGFQPAEITRPAGRFFLAVDNRSGREEVQLRLDRVAGNRLREARVHRNRPDWRDLVDLTPGSYRLTEANHPAWVCQITITAR